MRSTRSRQPVAPKARAGCLGVVASSVIGVIEAVLLAACMLTMYLGLKTNGQVFTEVLVSTRRETWIIASTVALAAGAVVFGYTVVYAIARRSWLPLMVQTVILATVIGLVIWFHGAIPVPAGVVSPGVGP